MTPLGRILAELAIDSEFAYRCRLGSGGTNTALFAYFIDRGVAPDLAQALVLAYLAGAMHATETIGRQAERVMAKALAS